MAVYRNLETNEVGDVMVVRFLDRKVAEDGLEEIAKRLYVMIDIDKLPKILLNLENVEMLSSAALGKLVTMHKKATAVGSVIKLSNVRPELYEVLSFTKLTKLFDVQDDEAAAVAAF